MLKLSNSKDFWLVQEYLSMMREDRRIGITEAAKTLNARDLRLNWVRPWQSDYV